mmetsp:Transcript_96298/g.274354  ORF Transcript_96298/g.274354 Transcript_96298/m.274354 type:complete len:274 (-) Transcript_96298:593-1414(-)
MVRLHAVEAHGVVHESDHLHVVRAGLHEHHLLLRGGRPPRPGGAPGRPALQLPGPVHGHVHAERDPDDPVLFRQRRQREERHEAVHVLHQRRLQGHSEQVGAAPDRGPHEGPIEGRGGGQAEHPLYSRRMLLTPCLHPDDEVLQGRTRVRPQRPPRDRAQVLPHVDGGAGAVPTAGVPGHPEYHAGGPQRGRAALLRLHAWHDGPREREVDHRVQRVHLLRGPPLPRDRRLRVLDAGLLARLHRVRRRHLGLGHQQVPPIRHGGAGWKFGLLR